MVRYSSIVRDVLKGEIGGAVKKDPPSEMRSMPSEMTAPAVIDPSNCPYVS
jgi:hypothetical protein